MRAIAAIDRTSYAEVIACKVLVHVTLTIWRSTGLTSAMRPADVPLPEGIIAPTEENDELRAEADADTGKPEKWTETGLHTVQ